MRRHIVIIGLLLLIAGSVIASVPVPKEESGDTLQDVREPFDATKTLNPPPSSANLTFWAVYINIGDFIKLDALISNGTVRVEIYTIEQTSRKKTALFNQTGTSFTQTCTISEENTYYIQIRNQNSYVVAISGKIRIQETVTTAASHNVYPYAFWGLSMIIPGFVVLIAGIISKQKADRRRRKRTVTFLNGFPKV